MVDNSYVRRMTTPSSCRATWRTTRRSSSSKSKKNTNSWPCQESHLCNQDQRANRKRRFSTLTTKVRPARRKLSNKSTRHTPQPPSEARGYLEAVTCKNPLLLSSHPPWKLTRTGPYTDLLTYISPTLPTSLYRSDCAKTSNATAAWATKGTSTTYLTSETTLMSCFLPLLMGASASEPDCPLIWDSISSPINLH